MSKRGVPCQFFTLGSCTAAACAFSHDRALCVPGAIGTPCPFLAGKGFCRNGDKCLYVHARAQAAGAAAGVAAGAAAGAAAAAPAAPQRRTAAVPQQPVQPPEQRQPLPLEPLPPQPLQPLQAPVRDDEAVYGDETPGYLPTQDEFHASLERDEQLYFYGAIPAPAPGRAGLQPASSPSTLALLRPPQGRAQAAPDWSKIARAGEDEVELQRRLAAMELAAEGVLPPAAPKAAVCKFFLQPGGCRRGATCLFSHVVDPERELVELERQASLALECGICLERPSDKSERFGLLTSCDHAFCLRCIKDWRSSDMAHKEESRGTVRRCPLCRECSFFIVPCDRMVRDRARKQKLIDAYQANLRQIDCKHFDRGNGTCPFGTSCFYRHIYENGLEQSPADVRFFKDAAGNNRADQAARLGTFLAPALRSGAAPPTARR
jgi:hypothetical protein